MDFLVEHAYAVSGIMLGILALHILEHIFRGRRRGLSLAMAAINFLMHVFLVAFFLLSGAGMEELLLMLLLSVSMGLVRKEA
ncbi:MAG: hypothetical protein ACOX31_01325 [Eubacteriales bacterium]|jgi:hypothetical protein